MKEAIDLRTAIDVIRGDIIKIVGRIERIITHPEPIHESKTKSAITFCSDVGASALDLIFSTNAGVVLCRDNESLNDLAVNDKTLIVVKNPRLSFLRLVAALFSDAPLRGIHPSAVIDPEAKDLKTFISDLLPISVNVKLARERSSMGMFISTRAMFGSAKK